jgi:hypothetical protein
MRQYDFQLLITAEQYLDYYRGTIRHVIVQCDDGRSMQFPAALLRKFIGSTGIQGKFRLICDANNKCIELRKL